jgi:DHA1 family tetracycline resistance protein-like MFS transporter
VNATGRKPLPPGFGVIWTTVVIDLIGFGIVLPILPLYAERFGASPYVATTIVASFSLAQFAAAPLWGRLSDRIGRRPVLVMALCGSAIGALLTGLAGSLPLLFLGRVIDGASGSSYAVAQAAATDLADPRDRPRLLGLLGAAFGVGFVAGPIIGGLAALGGRRLPFFIAAGFAAANAIATLVRVPETHKPGTSAPDATTRRFVPPTRVFREAGGRAALRLVVLALIGMAAFSGFESTFALLMNRRFDAENGVIYTLFAVIGIVLVYVQARLITKVHHRYSTTVVLRASLASNACGMVLLAIDGGWGTLAPALLFLTVGQGLLGPTLSSSIAGAVRTERRGEALGLQQSASSLGRVLGPIGAGSLFSAVGVGSPYLVAGALLVVAVALVPSVLAPVPVRAH